MRGGHAVRGQDGLGSGGAGGSRSAAGAWERSGSAGNPGFGKRIPERARGWEPFNLCSQGSWVRSGVCGLVVPVAGAIPTLRAVSAFPSMPHSQHRSHMTWMHFCVPRCPLTREHDLFLERLITLKEWIPVPISSRLCLSCLSCFDPPQCFDPSFLPSLDGRRKEYPGWDPSVSLSDTN